MCGVSCCSESRDVVVVMAFDEFSAGWTFVANETRKEIEFILTDEVDDDITRAEIRFRSEKVSLERAVFERCTPGQLPLFDKQRLSRQKSVRFLQDLVAAAVLPLHSADFPSQLSDFAHAWS